MKEQDAAHSLNQEESLLVKMTAILNSIAMEFDRNGVSPAVKSLVDKGYHLSLEGIEHLGVLDKQAAELTRLHSELEQERELRKELVNCLEVHQTKWISADHYWGSDTNEWAETLIEKAKLNN